MMSSFLKHHAKVQYVYERKRARERGHKTKRSALLGFIRFFFLKEVNMILGIFKDMTAWVKIWHFHS